jgi:hypothetical protein
LFASLLAQLARKMSLPRVKGVKLGISFRLRARHQLRLLR